MSHLTDLSTESGGEPAWDIAQLFPAQGAWTEEDYLTLNSNRLVEFDNGFVEVHAKAGIAEYWIADPENKEVSVLVLDGSDYRTRGVYGVDDEATSQLLDGFRVSVKELFAMA